MDIVVGNDSEPSMKPAAVNIDKLFMARQSGTVTLPLQVTGSWRLSTRIWIGTKLLLLAAWVMNLGIDVGTVPCEGCDGKHASCDGCGGSGVRTVKG